MSADVSDIEAATYGHADLDCALSVVNAKDYIRAIPTAWCAKIHCDDCPSLETCPNPSSDSDWSASKCHSEAFNMLGFATRKAADALHTLDWVIPTSPRLETIEASPGAKIEFEWSGSHDVFLMASTGAAESCDFSGATNLGSTSPISYTIPSTTSTPSTIVFSCSVGGHCANGQKLTVNVTQVNLTLSENYYSQSLDAWPENCGAMGYLSELYMTTERQNLAIFTMNALCTICGASHSATTYAKQLINSDASVDLPESCISPTPSPTTPSPTIDSLTLDSGASSAVISFSCLLTLLLTHFLL